MKALDMGVNLAELVNGCPRQSEQAMVYLDVFFSDDTAVIAMDKIIDIGDAARRGIFNGQDAVADFLEDTAWTTSSK